MRKISLWLPFLLGAFIVFDYWWGRKVNLQFSSTYFLFLYAIPLALLVFRKVSFADLGLARGNLPTGLFMVFLLPTILLFRLKLTGSPVVLGLPYQGLIVGSIGEELFFRGYLQGQFEKLFGANIGIGITNLFFMLVHVVKGYSLVSSLMIFAVGVYFSFGRDKRGGGSTFYSMAAHGLYNLVTTSMPRL